MSELILPDESYQIMGACFEVYNEMGPGFLESVYHECLEIQFSERSVPFTSKPQLSLCFKSKRLITYFQADFVCWNQIVIEIKAATCPVDDNTAQLLNYLNATRLPLGILVNFGHHPKLEYKRIALTQRIP